MSQFVRIAIATGDDTKRLIHQAVGKHSSAGVVAEAGGAQDLIDAVDSRRPGLAFVSADLELKGLEVAGTLARRYPHLFIAMVSPRHDPDEIRRAMKVGARECLFEPVTEEQVLRVISEAQELGQAGRGRMGTIVAVTSSKGGVGKSIIAANLAVALKQSGRGRVALIDGDLYFGDLASLLNLKPDRTIHDLNAALDADIADRFLLRHQTGIEVLAAPLRAEQAEEITPERFRAVIAVLQDLYDYLVVDVTVTGLDTMLATLDVADLALVVSTLDVICLKDVSQMVEMLTRLRFPMQNLLLVGNRFDERLSVPPKDAERTLGVKFTAVLPREDRVILTANRGVPIIVEAPRIPFSQKIASLASMITAREGRREHVTA